MEDLQALIRTTHDAREVKRALAVRNTLQGRSYADVADELGYSVSWVDKWRRRYAQSGAKGLRVGYRGSQSYLTAEQKTEIREWLWQQPTWSVRPLAAHIDTAYGIRYKSIRSYHALLNAARMSWKKSQNTPPEADPVEVAKTQERLKKKRTRRPRPWSVSTVSS